MRTKPRLLVAVMAAAIAVNGAVPACADDVTDADIASSRQAESTTQSTIASTEVRLAQLSAESNTMAISAAKAQAEAVEARQNLASAINDAIDAQDAADRAKDDVAQARKQLSQVSTAIYRDGAGSVTGSTYVFGADSFSQASKKSDAYRVLNNKTNRDLERLQAAQSVADTLQKRADEKASSQQKLAAQAEDAEAAAAKVAQDSADRVQAIAAERDGLIGQLAAQQNTTKELVAQQQEQKEAAARAAAEAEAQRIRAAAEQAAAEKAARDQAAARAAQEAAAQRAAQRAAAQQAAAAQAEARRQAAQAEAQRQAAAQQSAAAEARRQAAAAQEAAAAEARRQAAARQQNNTVPSNTGLGNQIVAYARQFVGVPYVWGKYSPSTGWDCVGFTYYVFSHFGYTTPRRTGNYVSQFWGAYTSRIVPASQRQPGDLMWWPGHVGIYTGGNMHIAAWNPSMGTQERAVWGNPVYIRIVG